MLEKGKGSEYLICAGVLRNGLMIKVRSPLIADIFQDALWAS
jgi:hypothetical protein